MDLLLTQAFEESRYYRRFHHTIFVLAITLYSGLLALQLSKPIITNQGFTKWALVAIVGLIIPIYLCRLIIQYHVTIAKLNYVIYSLGSSKYRASRDSLHDTLLPHAENQAINDFLFKKYGMAVAENRDIRFVGRGHWFFVGIIALLVFVNAIVFINTPNDVVNSDPDNLRAFCGLASLDFATKTTPFFRSARR